jgi:hypothetical protein
MSVGFNKLHMQRLRIQELDNAKAGSPAVSLLAKTKRQSAQSTLRKKLAVHQGVNCKQELRIHVQLSPVKGTAALGQ